MALKQQTSNKLEKCDKLLKINQKILKREQLKENKDTEPELRMNIVRNNSL